MKTVASQFIESLLSQGHGLITHWYDENIMKCSLNKSKKSLSLTSIDPNPRLYQAPRGIKSPELQTSLSAIPNVPLVNVGYK